MERAIQILIYTHAGFGGIAILAGLVSIIAKKGLTIHKKSGLVFYFTMLSSAVTALIVSLLPNHESPFLFAVGVFTLYFILTGKRALRFKHKGLSLRTDQWISRIMIVTGLLMIFLPVFLSKSINLVLSVFAVVGIIFSVRDLILFKNPARLRKAWLKLHLGKMLGAYISAITAFVVVNEFFPSFYGWFIPGLVGGFFIFYHIRRLNRKEMVPIKNSNEPKFK